MTRCLLVAVLLGLPFLVACGEPPHSEGEGETRYTLAVIPSHRQQEGWRTGRPATWRAIEG